MKKLLLRASAIAALLCATGASASAQTVLRIAFEGVFSQTLGAGHPNIDTGDTFSFWVEFDDTDVTGGGGSTMYTRSILGSGFTVNGGPHAYHPIANIQLYPDFTDLAFPARLAMAADGSALNTVIMNQSSLGGGTPSVAGSTAEFLDLLAFDDMPPANVDFIIRGNAPSNAMRATVTSFSVTQIPEPGGAVLGGVAVVGMLLRRRR
ncbi:MAG: hypothetical protein V4726_15895 [Verrucomicrobiota bacterium]